MKKIRITLAAMCTSMLLPMTTFAGPPVLDLSGSELSLMQHDNTITLSEKLRSENQEIYLPLRSFLEQLSPASELIWHEDQSMELHTETHAIIRLAINKNEITLYHKDGDAAKKISLFSSPRLINEKTFIPYELLYALSAELPFAENLIIYDSELTPMVLSGLSDWANALISRDGKPRYELMSEQMKQEFVKNQKALIGNDNWNYIIGVSSPWTTAYQMIACGSFCYITYYQTDSTGARYTQNEILTFWVKDGKLEILSSAEPAKPCDQLCGYLISMDENTVTIDPAEYISANDTARIRTLALTTDRMPDGYFIYNPEEDEKTYTLSPNTLFRFSDQEKSFVGANAENPEYTTTDKTAFSKYLETYAGGKPDIPFFFQLNEDQILAVSEISEIPSES